MTSISSVTALSVGGPTEMATEGEISTLTKKERSEKKSHPFFFRSKAKGTCGRRRLSNKAHANGGNEIEGFKQGSLAPFR